MILVVDASVALKWFFRARDDEQDTKRALAILEALAHGSLRMVEPPHFLAEVAAVLAREKPGSAEDDLASLQAIDWEVVEAPEIYTRAVQLSSALGHHLFDTLYHATALHSGQARLVTADGRYERKAAHLGGILRLSDLRLPLK